MWNLVFLFTGLIFISLLIIVFKSKKRIVSRENKLFLILSISNLVGFVIEIFLQIIVRNMKIGIFTFIIAKLYIMFIFIWFTIFSVYTFLLTINHDNTIRYEKLYKNAKKFHIIID